MLLIPAEQQDGPAYRVGFKNFEVITRYNRSARYAMAVHDLATRSPTRVAARAPLRRRTKLAAQSPDSTPQPADAGAALGARVARAALAFTLAAFVLSGCRLARRKPEPAPRASQLRRRFPRHRLRSRHPTSPIPDAVPRAEPRASAAIRPSTKCSASVTTCSPSGGLCGARHRLLVRADFHAASPRWASPTTCTR